MTTRKKKPEIKTALLLIGHGSRAPEADKVLVSVAAALRSSSLESLPCLSLGERKVVNCEASWEEPLLSTGRFAQFDTAPLLAVAIPTWCRVRARTGQCKWGPPVLIDSENGGLVAGVK